MLRSAASWSRTRSSTRRPGTTVERLGQRRTSGRRGSSVADDGPGIERDAQAHVFDRFYRLDGSVASGSGLGLAIARELATLMGGRLELVSLPGSTRFTLVLPADAAERVRAARARAAVVQIVDSDASRPAADSVRGDERAAAS